MGQYCFTPDIVDSVATERSELIDSKNEEDFRKILKEVRVLLLGKDGSGKRILVRQLKNYHLSGSKTEEDIIQILPVIYEQVFSNMKQLIKLATNLMGEDIRRSANRILEFEIRPNISNNEFLQQFTRELWNDLKLLWNDPQIHEVFICDDSHLIDIYFFNKLDAIMQPNFLPTLDDTFHIQDKTNTYDEDYSLHNFLEFSFEYKNNQFRIIEIGDKNGERRKWIQCFPNITALCFIIDISEFDEKLSDSNTKLSEIIQTFNETINHQYFINSGIIVILDRISKFKFKFENNKKISLIFFSRF